MAMSTAAKPYVVQDSVVAPQAETRSGWLRSGVVSPASWCRRGKPVWGLAALLQQATSTILGCCTHPGDVGMGCVGWSALLLWGGIMLLARARHGPRSESALAAVSCVFWLSRLP